MAAHGGTGVGEVPAAAAVAEHPHVISRLVALAVGGATLKLRAAAVVGPCI